MLEVDEVALLERSQRDRSMLEVVVKGCAYSCCGKGWQRRDGYEQTYYGYVDNLHPPDEGAGTFMLYSPGVGTLSYVVAVRFDEVEAIALHEPSPLAA